MILGEYAVDFELPEDWVTIDLDGIFNTCEIRT